MEIIIYTQINNAHKDKLLKEISQIINLTPVMVFDFEILFNFLKSKRSGQVVIVFLISEIEELEFLISNKVNLFNSRIILILPDRDDNFVSKGLSLYPRFHSHVNYGFKDVSAVLNKMIQNHALEEKNTINLKIS